MLVHRYLVEVGYTFSSYHHQQHGASGIMTYSCRKVESGAEVQDRKDSMVIGYYLLTWYFSFYFTIQGMIPD